MEAPNGIKERISMLAKGKSAAIFGAGASAKAAKALLEKLGIECAVYAEGSGKNGGENIYFESFDKFDPAKNSLVVYSPAFRPDNANISAS